MNFIDVEEKNWEKFNKAVIHPLQSYEWGEFRRLTNVQVIRRATSDFKTAYTMTIHKIPKLPYFIGYIPKCTYPKKEMLEDIKIQAEKYKCIYVQLEPDEVKTQDNELKMEGFDIRKSFHPLFTKYSFVLNLTPSEDELLKNMHSKTRYNIRVAQKHNVSVIEDNSEKGFQEFLKLYNETTKRQKFYAHTPAYHKRLWETLCEANKNKTMNHLSYHLLHAFYNKKVLTSWVLFSFRDTLYYPYGASSREHREVMASNLLMWEAIRLGKKLGLRKFDMWGALSENPNPQDPWYGFHKFKQGYGAELVEFMGSYDLVVMPKLYEIVKIADKIRWTLLKIKKI